VRLERVTLLRVAQGVNDQSLLAMVQHRDAAESRFDGVQRRGLALDVLVQFPHGPPDDIELLEDEVGQVIVVRLGEEESPSVLGRSFQEDLGDGDELEEPIPVPQHRPVEQSSRDAAVAVNERVVVGQPEMQDDRPQDRMEKPLRCSTVGEVTHGSHSLFELLGRRRVVKDLVVHVNDRDALIWQAQSSRLRIAF